MTKDMKTELTPAPSPQPGNERSEDTHGLQGAPPLSGPEPEMTQPTLGHVLGTPPITQSIEDEQNLGHAHSEDAQRLRSHLPPSGRKPETAQPPPSLDAFHTPPKIRRRALDAPSSMQTATHENPVDQEKPTDQKSLVDHIKHVRLVHFALTVTSSTLLYVSLVSGSHFPVLIAESQRLSHLAKELTEASDVVRAGDSHPVAASKIDLHFLSEGWHSRYRSRVTKTLSAKTSAALYLEPGSLKTAFLLRGAAFPAPSLDTATLEETWGWIGEQTLYTVELGDVISVSGLPVAPDDRVVVDAIIPHMPISGDEINATLEYFVSFVADGKRSIPIRESAQATFELREGQIVIDAERVERQSRTLREHWFDYKDLTFEELDSLLRDRLGDSIEAGPLDRINIGGYFVRNRDIGYVGPILVLATLLYLYLHLAALARARPARHHPPPLWVGTMSTALSRTVTVVTMAYIPWCAVTLSVYRFVTPTASAIFLGLIVLPVGFCAFRYSEILSNEE